MNKTPSRAHRTPAARAAIVAALALPYARALLRLKRPADARGPIGAATDYFRRKDLKPYLANSLTVAADVAEALGDKNAAAEAREEAASLRDEIRLPPALAARVQALRA